MKVKTINNRAVITAGSGKMVTDGQDIYGKKVILEVGLTAEGFYEITEEEYNAMFTIGEEVEE